MKRVSFTTALRKVFTGPRPLIEALVIAFLVFALFVLVPVWTTPGDSVGFQLMLLPLTVKILMVALAVLNGILITMQLYLRRIHSHQTTAKHAAAASGIAVSSLFAVIGCAACYSSLLALFGLSGSLFIATHRWWFATAALGLTLFALVETSRRVVGECACDVPKA